MKKRNRLVSMFLVASFILTTCISSVAQTALATTEKSDSKSVVIDATDYGADPSGKTDSAVAIWNAFEAAKQATADGATSVTVDFPKGEYHVYKDYAQQREYHTSNTDSTTYPIKTIGLLLENQSNFTLEGNDSLFMMHGNMMALAVVKSENVKLHNFAWDFSVPTVSEMTVMNMGTMDQKDYVDYYIPSCFPWEIEGTTIRWDSEKSPYTGELYWQEWGRHNSYSIVAHSPENETSKSYLNNQGAFEGVSSIEKIDENTARFKYNNGRTENQKKPIELGAVFQFVSSAVRETAGAFIWESSDTFIEEVDVHFMHGFGWLTQMSHNVYYKNCNFSSREGTGRYAMSYADGIHASGASGDFIIEGCNFANSHDDPINMHGTFTRVEQRIDDNTLKLIYVHSQQGGFPQYHVGDKVVFYTRDTLESTDSETEYTVTEVSNPGENGNNLKTSIVKFAEPLPKNLSDKVSNEPKYVAENITYAPKVTIRNNTFKHVSTRGILCTTRNPVLIEGNTFLNMNMASIFLSNDAADWYESGPIRDMTIRNNTFFIKEKPRLVGSDDEVPAILVRPITKGGGLPDASNPIHKNIIIDQNTFYMNEDSVVNASSVENLQITNNKILRYSNNVSIQIEAGKTTMLPGSTSALTTTTTGKQNTGSRDNVYEFNKCKDVLISGNTYDDGLKLNAVVYDEATKNTLTLNDPQIKLVGDKNQPAQPPISNLKYTTTDPTIATVDSQGNITAHKEGNVTVFAFYEWNGTAIKSNEIKLTVDNEDGTQTPTTFMISGDDNVRLTAKDQMHTFTTEVAPSDYVGTVKWDVLDAKTGVPTVAATIDQTGKLTAKSNGIVIVRAQLDGKTATQTVILSIPESKTLAPYFEIKRQSTEKWAPFNNGKAVEITMQAGDLYGGGGNNAKNVFLYTIPNEIPKDNMRTTLKITGLPARVTADNLWDSASFMLYKDDDNYVTIGKKSHMNGITRVNEKGAQATELAGNASDNAVSTAILSLYKHGDTISTYMKANDGAWVDCGDITGSGIGNAYKIGFATWGNEANATKVKFEDLRVANGLDFTNETILNTEPVVMINENNSAPTAANLSLTTASESGKETVKATYAYSDTDNHAEGQTLYKWSYTLNGQVKNIFTPTNTFETKTNGILTCTVYPADVSGAIGEPISANISVSGNTEPEVIFTGKDNYTQLEGLRIPILGVDELTVKPDSHFLVEKENSQVTIELLGSDRTGTIKLYHGDIRTPIALTKVGNTYSATVSVGSGLDSYFVETMAKDGITKGKYRIHFVRKASSDTTASDISIGQTTIPSFSPETLEYNYVMPTDVPTLPLTVTPGDDNNATVSITVNGKRSEGRVREISATDLQEGLNKVIVAIKADNRVSNQYYTLNIMRSTPTNAQLSNLHVENHSISPTFDQNTTNYQLNSSSDRLTVRATAQENDSRITVSSRNQNFTSSTNTITQDVNVYKGDNLITVKVTAPNNTTQKIYTIHVTVSGEVYLSDLNWEAGSSSGYGKLTKNRSVEGNQLKLATKPNGEDATGAPATYEKGIGANADATLIYNLQGKDFTRFQTYVGVDYANYNAPDGSIIFQVFLDNSTTAVFDSGIMRQKTPQQKIDIDVTGVQKLTLKALKVENNYNDHADWADAKLIKTLPDAPKVDKTVLNNLISSADAYQQQDYTAETWTIFSAAFISAKTIAQKSDATQQEVDDAVVSLNTAIAQLVEKPPVEGNANKTILNFAISYADGKMDEVATLVPSAKAKFMAAYNNAVDMKNKADATQSEVDQAWAMLFDAIHMLSFQAGDKANLIALIIACEGLNLDDYKDTVAFESALAAAIVVRDDADALALDVQKAYDDLNKAKSELILQDKDKSTLTAAIAYTEKIDQNLLIDNAAKAAVFGTDGLLATAKAVLAEPKSTQAQLDAAAEALYKAVADLRYKADKSTLDAVIKAAASVDENLYTPASFAAFNEAVRKGQEIFDNPDATKEQIAAAVEEISTKEMQLVKKEVPPTNNTGSKTEITADGANGTTNSATTGDSNTLPIVLAVGLVGLLVAGVAIKKRKDQ